MKTQIYILCFICLFTIANASTAQTKERKLNDKVLVFSDEAGEFWGAKVDGKIVIEPGYGGIDMLGDNYLRLMKNNYSIGKPLYGAADLDGNVEYACEYDEIVIEDGELQAIKGTNSLQDELENLLTFQESESETSSTGRTEVSNVDADDEDFYVQEDVFGEEAMDVVDYIIGDTRNPNIDMGYIRDENDGFRGRFLVDPEHDVNIKPVAKADKMPTYVGGEAEMHEFLRYNLEYPEDAKVLGVQGKVVVRFVVMPNGDIQDAEVLQGLEDTCNKEAIRLVELMPRWNPGEQKGVKIPVYFTLPISFFF